MLRQMITKMKTKCTDPEWVVSHSLVAGGILGGLTAQYFYVNRELHYIGIPDWIICTSMATITGAISVPIAFIFAPILIPSLAVSYGGLKIVQFYKDYNGKYINVQICDKHESKNE